MAEYIEMEALLKYPFRADHYDKEHGNEDFILGIESVLEYAQAIPAADVAPVVHGRWIDKQEDDLTEGMWRCSACGEDFYFSEDNPNEYGANYCTSCGAKMDGESGE